VQPRVKVWLEEDGRLVMSEYRLRLLAHVAECGSLTEAATRMGLSYRRAWGKVKELEQNLGVTLVESVHGGAGGGGSALTPAGRMLLDRYAAFLARAEAAINDVYADVFGGPGRGPSST
jgi:molybdate transport system regulatory protein